MARPTLIEASLSIKQNNNTIKFLCSYGGKIVPRYPDGKLRYHGGHTRVLAVPRSISFSELMIKMGDLCGTTVTLKCQLPKEDLDALISIKSDEDLVNLIEEYDRMTSSSMKVRAFLLPSKTSSLSPPVSVKSLSPKSLSPSSSFSAVGSSPRGLHQRPVMASPTAMCQNCCRSNNSQFYLVSNNNGNYWQ